MNYKSKFTGKQIDDGIDKANSAYQKPQNGIPSEDLSEDVQNSLDKIEALPDHIVTDANYVHTDNNYTTEEKTKLANAITEEQDPTVSRWAKQPTKPSYTPQEVGALPANTPLFDGNYNSLTNKPDLSGFITISVNNLVNYYLKSETYTKQEVQALIAAIQQFHYEIYASISAVTSPAGNVLYLIGPTGTGADKYEEYVYDATKQEPWVKIGDTSIDLSGYYTSQQTDAAITLALNTTLADYTSTAALTLLLAGKQDVINDLATIRSGAAAGATAYQKPQGGIPVSDLALGMDNVPTSGSDNFVKSGGVYSALQGKQNTLVSGTNIKTINNQSILGSGNITIQGSGSSVQSDWNQTDTEADDYIKNKPTIPAEQVQSDWNQTNNTSKDFIKNKPTIPTVPTNVSAFNNDAGYLTQHQDISGKADKSEMSVVDGTGANADKTTITLKNGTSATVLKSHQDISGKEDVTTIVAPVNTTDATLPITALTCEVGKYYRIDVAVDTLGVTLPAMTDLTTVRTVVLYLTTGTTPAITVAAADSKNVYYQDGFELEAGKTYEVNCLWNGLAWIVASVEIVVANNGGE